MHALTRFRRLISRGRGRTYDDPASQTTTDGKETDVKYVRMRHLQTELWSATNVTFTEVCPINTDWLIPKFLPHQQFELFVYLKRPTRYTVVGVNIEHHQNHIISYWTYSESYPWTKNLELINIGARSLCVRMFEGWYVRSFSQQVYPLPWFVFLYFRPQWNSDLEKLQKRTTVWRESVAPCCVVTNDKYRLVEATACWTRLWRSVLKLTIISFLKNNKIQRLYYSTNSQWFSHVRTMAIQLWLNRLTISFSHRLRETRRFEMDLVLLVGDGNLSYKANGTSVFLFFVVTILLELTVGRCGNSKKNQRSFPEFLSRQSWLLVVLLEGLDRKLWNDVFWLSIQKRSIEFSGFVTDMFSLGDNPHKPAIQVHPIQETIFCWVHITFLWHKTE